jgi:hypothetical protein
MVEADDLAVVLIVWADAHTGEHGWISNEIDPDDGEVLVHSVGFLVPADDGGKKDHITLWQSLCDDEGIARFHIPVAMVRTMKVLRPPKQD